METSVGWCLHIEGSVIYKVNMLFNSNIRQMDYSRNTSYSMRSPEQKCLSSSWDRGNGGIIKAYVSTSTFLYTLLCDNGIIKDYVSTSVFLFTSLAVLMCYVLI